MLLKFFYISTAWLYINICFQTNVSMILDHVVMLLLYWAVSVVNLCYSEELSARVEVLESTNQELERELDDLRESADKEAETKYTMIGELQERLSTLKSELLSLEGDKANILSEVWVAVMYTCKIIYP